MAERSPPTGERSPERGFDPAATAYRVERLSRRILGQHPELESPVGWAALDQLASCCGQQLPADAMPLESVGHVQVVQERAPVRVLVKDHVNCLIKRHQARRDKANHKNGGNCREIEQAVHEDSLLARPHPRPRVALVPYRLRPI